MPPPTITIPPANTLLGDASPIWHTNFTNILASITGMLSTFDTFVTTTILNTHKLSTDHDAHNDERYAPISIIAPMARTRSIIPFAITSASSGRAIFGGYVPSSSSDLIGLPLVQAGCIVGISVMNTSGGVYKRSLQYNDQGEHYFAAGSVITLYDDGGTDCFPSIDGSAVNALNLEGAGTVRCGTLVIES